MTEKLREKKLFLAGLIEGEGCLSASIKNQPGTRFGYAVDPEFFLYQHKQARELLDMAFEIFGTGRIAPKSGNEDVLVYSIASHRSIVEKVIPFFEEYIRPFGSALKWRNFEIFREIAFRISNGEHKSKEGMVYLVELAYQTNHAGKQRKRRKQEVIERILRDQTPKPLIKEA